MSFFAIAVVTLRVRSACLSRRQEKYSALSEEAETLRDRALAKGARFVS